MAKPRTPRTKKGTTTTNDTPGNGNSAVSNSSTELQAITAPETKLQPVTELRQQVSTDGKKNVVPINLEEEIRRRAYEIFAERGQAPGNEREDWLRAEREVRARYQQTA